MPPPLSTRQPPTEVDDDLSETTETLLTSEETLLLGNDLPPGAIPNSLFQQDVMILCMVFLTLIELGSLVQISPTKMLMEEIICRKRYPDLNPSYLALPDGPCKNPDVQGELAWISGWLNAFDSIPRKQAAAFSQGPSDSFSPSQFKFLNISLVNVLTKRFASYTRLGSIWNCRR
jgi:hypothetical protein